MTPYQRVRAFQKKVIEAAKKTDLNEGVMMDVLMSQSPSDKPIQLREMYIKLEWKGLKPHAVADNPDHQFRATRLALMLEEVVELFKAETEGDMIEVADALGDIIVIACGTAAIYGIDLDAVFNEIMDSNETKFNPDGTMKFRVDGKYLKGDNYRKPDIKGVLER